MNKKRIIDKLVIIALAAHGEGISGGDRIFIELAKRWSRIFPIDIYVGEEGEQMLKRQGVSGGISSLAIKVKRFGMWHRLGFITYYIARIIYGLYLGLSLKLRNDSGMHIYNASEFWMDSLACTLLKLRHPKIRWIATWYQTAPNPLIGYSEKGIRTNSYKFSALLYWLVQLPVKPLIAKFADKVIVNNEDEKKQFPKHTKNRNTVVLIGAVPLREIKEFLSTNYQLLANKKYDAVFQGRFHSQKGVVELVDIWKKVVDKKPDAKLVMIGDGPLRSAVESKIKDYKLNQNIKLCGFVFDGPKKYKLFAQSKIVVHPAFYDSGGMASAEAMAFGLPCIGFDLKAYASYYPKGMLKAKDKLEFARLINKLLVNKKLRDKVGQDALTLIKGTYSWEARSKQILKTILR